MGVPKPMNEIGLYTEVHISMFWRAYVHSNCTFANSIETYKVHMFADDAHALICVTFRTLGLNAGVPKLIKHKLSLKMNPQTLPGPNSDVFQFT